MSLFKIGPYDINNPVLLAPMAGVSDVPFRTLCHQFGASIVYAEMVSSQINLWDSKKSKSRLELNNAPQPKAVQLLGNEPELMCKAANKWVQMGAQIIDINMGCPAKKVCNKLAGSALLKDEKLVENILSAVTQSVDVPVTLKIRTGWDSNHKNAAYIGQIAESCGISALTIHGRTRACSYQTPAEYDTIADVKSIVSIPVIANGDIDSPHKSKLVLDHTNADAIMLGRSAQGNPWLISQINHFLENGEIIAKPRNDEISTVMLSHLQALHQFYGDYLGVRVARKHINWYLEKHQPDTKFRKIFNQIQTPAEQVHALKEFWYPQMDLY